MNTQIKNANPFFKKNGFLFFLCALFVISICAFILQILSEWDKLSIGLAKEKQLNESYVRAMECEKLIHSNEYLLWQNLLFLSPNFETKFAQREESIKCILMHYNHAVLSSYESYLHMLHKIRHFLNFNRLDEAKTLASGNSFTAAKTALQDQLNQIKQKIYKKNENIHKQNIMLLSHIKFLLITFTATLFLTWLGFIYICFFHKSNIKQTHSIAKEQKE